MRLILIFISFLIVSCSTLNNSKKKYFEGSITYEIDYISSSKNFSPSYLKQFSGNKMILTFKKGDYKKEYFSSNGQLIATRYINLKAKKGYFRDYSTDTIYWIDITKNDSKTTFKTISDTSILQYQCLGLETKTQVNMMKYPDTTFQVGGKYFFSKTLKINPNWYNNYFEGNYNEIIKVGKGIQLLNIENNGLWISKTTAVKIEKHKVKQSDINFVKTKTSILQEL